MRIALACPYAWDAPGGVQVHVRQLAARMRDRGHEVVVLAPSSLPAEGIVRTGAPVRVRFNRSVAPIAPWPAAVRRAREALASFRPDVVHVHEPFVPGAAGVVRAASRAGVPLVGTFHAYADRAAVLDLVAPLLRTAWHRLDVRIAVSEAAAAFVTRRLPDGEVRVVPNGVDTELFAGADPAELPSGRRVLFVNRLDPRKGFPVMVRAFTELHARRPEALLIVAGDGPDRGAVRGTPSGARERIVMLGNVPHERLPAIHAACEVFCAPSVGRESFGIVLVEAMAAGLPVVATDIPGYREVVRRDVDGLLVPPSDPMATAAAVARVLEDRELAERLRRAGRERAERYAWTRVAAQVETAYEDAIRGR